MRWMTVAMVFAAASGYVVMVLAAAVLGTDGADRWLVFWSSFFAVAAVANGMLQETTRAVGEAQNQEGQKTQEAQEPQEAQKGQKTQAAQPVAAPAATTAVRPNKPANPLRTGGITGIGLGALAALPALWWAHPHGRRYREYLRATNRRGLVIRHKPVEPLRRLIGHGCCAPLGDRRVIIPGLFDRADDPTGGLPNWLHDCDGLRRDLVDHRHRRLPRSAEHRACRGRCHRRAVLAQ